MEHRLKEWARKDKTFPATEGEKRTVFKHDEDEIVYSTAFRRLSRKSQIVVKPEHADHYRSRLTHTLEVTQIAQSLALRLGLDMNLVSAIAKGHDIGHTPFGHPGERAVVDLYVADVLPLCDGTRLETNLKGLYRFGAFDFSSKKGKSTHWLFHHGLNSRRIIQRKLRGVSDATLNGVMRHSWSPWQSKVKFGTPRCYEAQAVAVADQVAGITHDTEDLLNCRESGFANERELREEATEHIRRNAGLSLDRTRGCMRWFLPEEATADNGWGRKRRLAAIIDDVEANSSRRLESRSVRVWMEAANPQKALAVSDDMARFLGGYEDFVRNAVLKEVPWFKNRDEIASAVVRSVYTFLLHHYPEFSAYCTAGQPELGRTTENGLHRACDVLDREQRIASVICLVHNHVQDSAYRLDEHLRAISQSAEDEDRPDVEHAVKVLDYVTGMTDRYIMDVHRLALGGFEAE